MCEFSKELENNLRKVHSTILGIDRIKKNLNLKDCDVVSYCKEVIKDEESKIYKKGKNYYVEKEDIIITINASSYTIITAHKKK